jgi:hypothetical protein
VGRSGRHAGKHRKRRIENGLEHVDMPRQTESFDPPKRVQTKRFVARAAKSEDAKIAAERPTQLTVLSLCRLDH